MADKPSSAAASSATATATAETKPPTIAASPPMTHTSKLDAKTTMVAADFEKSSDFANYFCEVTFALVRVRSFR